MPPATLVPIAPSVSYNRSECLHVLHTGAARAHDERPSQVNNDKEGKGDSDNDDNDDSDYKGQHVETHGERQG